MRLKRMATSASKHIPNPRLALVTHLEKWLTTLLTKNRVKA